MSIKSFALHPLSAVLLSLTLSHVAVAADDKVETVYVSATRSEGPQMPVATQITVIDAEQIRVSGAETVTEVLRTQSGIQILDQDGSGGRSVTVSMRGFSASAANNTLVLVDGRKLNNPNLAGPALNTIALNDIERIEIVQGSAGVLYGDQAVGGVINVITRKAKPGELYAVISAEKGSNDLEAYAATINQAFANGLNYSLSAQKRNTDNYRENNQSSVSNVLGNIGFNFEAGKVFLEQQKITDDLRLPGSLFGQQLLIDRRHSDTPNNYTNQDTDLKRAGGEVSITDNWRLLGEYADRDESGNYFYDPYASAYKLRVKNITPRVVGNIETSQGNSVVTLGYDRVDSDYATKDGYTDITQIVNGLYGQIIYPLTQTVTATAGARHSTVDDKNHHAYDDNFNVIEKSRTLSLNTRELGVNYQMNSSWRAFARVADGFRFANSDENAFTLPGINFLNVQTNQSQEAGLVWAEQAASVKYSVYRMNVDDEIMYDPVVVNPHGFGGHGANINLPRSERKGFIFEGDVDLSEQLSLRANYTYTDATLTSGNFKGNRVPFVANNTANAAVVFHLIQNVTASFDANYTGTRFHADDFRNKAAKIDALTLFSANVLWNINDLELGFRVKNITNEKYSDYSSIYGEYPQAERSYNAHMTYHF